MKGTRFTEERIIRVLKDRDGGTPIKDLSCIHGVSDATIYNSKVKSGGSFRPVVKFAFIRPSKPLGNVKCGGSDLRHHLRL